MVELDTDDKDKIDIFIKKLKKATRWWKFNKWIVVPMGCVKITKIT